MNAPVDPAALARISLDDKYTLERGRVYLTGTQALVRLPMMQRLRDAAAGGYQIKYVFLTHFHADHVEGVRCPESAVLQGELRDAVRRCQENARRGACRAEILNSHLRQKKPFPRERLFSFWRTRLLGVAALRIADPCLHPAARQRQLYAVASLQPRCVQHDPAVRPFGNAVTALEHRMRIEAGDLG